MNDSLQKGAIVARNVSIITFILASVKFLVAQYTNSVSILADSYHSFADLIPIVAAWIGLKIAQRPRNEKFPYGYYKAENLAAFLASLFIFLLAYEIIMESIHRLNSHGSIEHTLTGLVFTSTFVLISYLLYRYQLKAALSSNSQALMANARETKMDVFSSAMVLGGFAGTSIGYPWLGGLVGLIISLLVIHAGYESLKDSVLSLMDAGVPGEEMKKIKETIINTPRVKSINSLYARRSGPFVMVEVEISVPENLNVKQAHAVATEVEKMLMSMKEVDHAIVHVEPPQKTGKLVAIPVSGSGEMCKNFGTAPYFAIYREKSGKIEFVERMKNPGAKLSKKRGVKAALFLIEKGIDRVEVINIGEDSKKILEDAGVTVIKR